MTSWTTLTIAASNTNHDALADALETHSDSEAFTTNRNNANIDTVSIRLDGVQSDAALRVLATVSSTHEFTYGVITAAEDTGDTAAVTVYTQTEAGLEQHFSHVFPGHPRGGLSNIAAVLEETHCINAPVCHHRT